MGIQRFLRRTVHPCCVNRLEGGADDHGGIAMNSSEQMTSELRHELEHRAIYERCERRIMQACAIICVVIVGLKIAGVL
jgi:hypothetical protein